MCQELPKVPGISPNRTHPKPKSRFTLCLAATPNQPATSKPVASGWMGLSTCHLLLKDPERRSKAEGVLKLTTVSEEDHQHQETSWWFFFCQEGQRSKTSRSLANPRRTHTMSDAQHGYTKGNREGLFKCTHSVKTPGTDDGCGPSLGTEAAGNERIVSTLHELPSFQVEICQSVEGIESWGRKNKMKTKGIHSQGWLPRTYLPSFLQ